MLRKAPKDQRKRGGERENKRGIKNRQSQKDTERHGESYPIVLPIPKMPKIYLKKLSSSFSFLDKFSFQNKVHNVVFICLDELHLRDQQGKTRKRRKKTILDENSSKRKVEPWFLYQMVAHLTLRMYDVDKVFFSKKKSSLMTLSM